MAKAWCRQELDGGLRFGGRRSSQQAGDRHGLALQGLRAVQEGAAVRRGLQPDVIAGPSGKRMNTHMEPAMSAQIVTDLNSGAQGVAVSDIGPHEVAAQKKKQNTFRCNRRSSYQ